MFSFLARKWEIAKRKAAADLDQEEAFTKYIECVHCDGEGEVRVRGIRTVTGYTSCAYCGGIGKVPPPETAKGGA